MGMELINRITVKKDGVYLSTHSSNDNCPYHSVRIEHLSEVYKTEGQKGLDREIICMLLNFAALRGNHHSIARYKYAYQHPDTHNICEKYTLLKNECYDKLSDEDKRCDWRFDPPETVKKYLAENAALDYKKYTEIAEKCAEFDRKYKQNVR